MKVQLKTAIHTDIERFWVRLNDPTSLQFVAAPIIDFEGIAQATFEENWKEGETYTLPIRYFGRIPAGVQTVTMVTIDATRHQIVTNESGGVAAVWYHTMQLRALADGLVEYRDTLEITAGYKTPLLWLFVQLFYRHRQRRWRKLLQQP